MLLLLLPAAVVVVVACFDCVALPIPPGRGVQATKRPVFKAGELLLLDRQVYVCVGCWGRMHQITVSTNVLNALDATGAASQENEDDGSDSE